MIWCSMMWCWVFSMTSAGYVNGIQSSKVRWFLLNPVVDLWMWMMWGKSLLNSKFACKTLHFFFGVFQNMWPNVFLPLSIHGDQLPLPVVPEICCRTLPFAMSGLSLVWDLGSRCFVPLDPWGAAVFFKGFIYPPGKCWTHIPPYGRLEHIIWVF